MPGSNTHSLIHPPRPTPRQSSKTIPTPSPLRPLPKQKSSSSRRRIHRPSSTFSVVAAIAVVAEASSAKAIPWHDNDFEYNLYYNSYSAADWVTARDSTSTVLDFLYPTSYLVNQELDQQQQRLRRSTGERQALQRQQIRFSHPEVGGEEQFANSVPSTSCPRPSPAESSFLVLNTGSVSHTTSSAAPTTLVTRSSNNNEPRYTPRAVLQPRKRSYKRNRVNNDKSNKNSNGKKYKNRKRSNDGTSETTRSSSASPSTSSSTSGDSDSDWEDFNSGIYTQRIIPDRYELGGDGRWHKVSLWTSCSVCQAHEVDDTDLDSSGTLGQDDSDLAVSSSSASASGSVSSSSSSTDVVYPEGWDRPASDSEVYKVPLIVVASLIVAAGVSCAVFLAIMWRRRRRRVKKEALQRDPEKKMKKLEGKESDDEDEDEDDEDDDDGGGGRINGREMEERERRRRAFRRGNRSLRSSLVSLRDVGDGVEDESREREKEKAKARLAKANALWKLHARWIQRRRRGRGISSTGSGTGTAGGSPVPIDTEREETRPEVEDVSTVMVASGVSLRRSGSGGESRPRGERAGASNQDRSQDLRDEENEVERVSSRDTGLEVTGGVEEDRGSNENDGGEGDVQEDGDREDVRERPPAYVSRREERRRERRDEKRALDTGAGRDGTGYVPSPGDYAPFSYSDSESDSDSVVRRRGSRRSRSNEEIVMNEEDDDRVRTAPATLHVAVDDKRALERMAAYASAPSAPVSRSESTTSEAHRVANAPSWNELELESELDPVMEYSVDDGMRIPDYEYEYRAPGPVSASSTNVSSDVSFVGNNTGSSDGGQDVDVGYRETCIDSPGAGPGPSTVMARNIRASSVSSVTGNKSFGLLPPPPEAVSTIPLEGLAYTPLDSLGLEPMPPGNACSHPSGSQEDIMAGASAPPLLDDDEDDDNDYNVGTREELRERINDGDHVEGSDRNEVLSAVR